MNNNESIISSQQSQSIEDDLTILSEKDRTFLKRYFAILKKYNKHLDPTSEESKKNSKKQQAKSKISSNINDLQNNSTTTTATQYDYYSKKSIVKSKGKEFIKRLKVYKNDYNSEASYTPIVVKKDTAKNKNPQNYMTESVCSAESFSINSAYDNPYRMHYLHIVNEKKRQNPNKIFEFLAPNFPQPFIYPPSGISYHIQPPPQYSFNPYPNFAAQNSAVPIPIMTPLNGISQNNYNNYLVQQIPNLNDSNIYAGNRHSYVNNDLHQNDKIEQAFNCTLNSNKSNAFHNYYDYNEDKMSSKGKQEISGKKYIKLRSYRTRKNYLTLGHEINDEDEN